MKILLLAAKKPQKKNTDTRVAKAPVWVLVAGFLDEFIQIDLNVENSMFFQIEKVCPLICGESFSS